MQVVIVSCYKGARIRLYAEGVSPPPTSEISRTFTMTLTDVEIWLPMPRTAVQDLRSYSPVSTGFVIGG